MTYEEAIKILRFPDGCVHTDDFSEALDVGLNCIEKQIAKKPIRIDKSEITRGNFTVHCPTCHRLLMERITTDDVSYPRVYNNEQHCWCGQKIDWYA